MAAPDHGWVARVLGAVSLFYLRRWLVAIALIVGFTTFGMARSTPSPQGPPATGAGSAGIGLTASGWHGTDAVMPARPQIDVPSGYERGIRVKLALFVATLAAALARTVAPRTASRRDQRAPLPLALRARSLPLRAPPLLLLG